MVHRRRAPGPHPAPGDTPGEAVRAGGRRPGAALAGHPQVAFAAAISGTHNLHASVDALYDYLTTLLAGLPQIRARESSLVLETTKRHYLGS